MKIGMMADMYKPYVSGVTSYISLYKRFLEKAGHEVFVFTFGQGINDAEPNVIRSPGVHLFVRGIYSNLNYSRQAQNLLEKMDVAHVHHPMVSARLALKYCRPNGIPIVFTNHTRYDIYAKYFFVPPIGRIYLYFLRKYLPEIYRNMDAVIVPSEKIKPILEPFGLPREARVIPHGVDINLFRAETHHNRVRQSSEITEEAVVLLYVGRLGYEKNLPAMLHQFRDMKFDQDRVYLMIVGEGPVRRKLEVLSKQLGISQNIRFTGEVSYSDLPDYYHSADIFLMPSLYETFGFTVVESMASGLPVVGYDVPGINDTVDDNVTGFLASTVGNDFSDKVIQLVGDPSLRQKMGHQAVIASEKFSIEASMAKLIDTYQELVARKQGN